MEDAVKPKFLHTPHKLTLLAQVHSIEAKCPSHCAATSLGNDRTWSERLKS